MSNVVLKRDCLGSLRAQSDFFSHKYLIMHFFLLLYYRLINYVIKVESISKQVYVMQVVHTTNMI